MLVWKVRQCFREQRVRQFVVLEVCRPGYWDAGVPWEFVNKGCISSLFWTQICDAGTPKFVMQRPAKVEVLTFGDTKQGMHQFVILVLLCLRFSVMPHLS